MSGGRYELKFLINPEAREQLLSRMDALIPDSHGENGVYPIRSLYYDTPSLQAFYEKLDGVRIRHKFRLRYYGKGIPERGFFEIKSRYDRIISKVRFPLGPEHWQRLLESPDALLALPTLDSEEGKLGAQLISRTHLAEGLRPSVVTSYTREAYLCSYDSSVRVTFDHACQGLLAESFPLEEDQEGEALCDRQEIILELKFNHRLPGWIRDAVTGMGIKAVRFSKYAEAVIALGSVGKLQV